MAILKPVSGRPNTYPYANGVKVGQAVGTFNGVDYQEGKITRASATAPVKYAKPLITLVQTGIEKPGLQTYTSP